MHFSYEDKVWIDSIEATDTAEEPFIYDDNGNPISMEDLNFHWTNGRNLVTITDSSNNDSISYTYNRYGYRTSKTVNGVSTNYIVDEDGTVVAQKTGNDTLYFEYDNYGSPLGFVYNGVQYLYITNIRNDVIAITDTTGTVVAGYTYGDWGECTVDSTSTNLALANLNPLRYRGYYYDNETGYYYLQSRYYDPSICRFINSDLPEYAQMQKNDYAGTNLFAYCCNDAVNNVDANGFWKKDVHNGYNTNKRNNYYTFNNSTKGYGTYFWAKCVGFSDNFAQYIAYWCNFIDTLYDPSVPSQKNNSWHFNSTWYSGYDTYDTRNAHSIELIEAAKRELRKANKLYNTSKYKTHLKNALKYIGYALHPIQDKYAHTRSVSHLLAGSNKYNIVYFHWSNKGVDDANKHISAVNNAGEQTKRILRDLYNNYSLLRLKGVYFYV